MCIDLSTLSRLHKTKILKGTSISESFPIMFNRIMGTVGKCHTVYFGKNPWKIDHSIKVIAVCTESISGRNLEKRTNFLYNPIQTFGQFAYTCMSQIVPHAYYTIFRELPCRFTPAG